MNSENARTAANILWGSWKSGQRLRQLPDGCRPRTLGEGYVVQAMLEEVSGCASLGWKIAATNVTGQKHIGVDRVRALGNPQRELVAGKGRRFCAGQFVDDPRGAEVSLIDRQHPAE